MIDQLLLTIAGAWHGLTSRPDFWGFITIPIVLSAVTWMHVWMALKMVFYPIKFLGFRLGNLPIGWQGIVPRKASKMAGIMVDQTLSKLGSIKEFLHAMDPVEMANMICDQVGDELEHLIDEVMVDRSAVLWENLPYAIKRRIYRLANKQLPDILRELVTELTFNVESLVDMKSMVVKQMENDPALMVRMFLKVGHKEINFIWHISALIGFTLGFVQMFVWLIVPWHWTLVFWAALWGLLTNWIAIWMVFNPVNPVHIRGPHLFSVSSKFPFIRPAIPSIATYTLHGAFMRRQVEVSTVFAEVVTSEVITLKNIMTEMMYGDRKEQTRRIMKRHVNTITESPLVRTTLQLSIGLKEYATLKSELIDKSIEVTMIPVADPELNRSRAQKIFSLFRDRIAALSPHEFQSLLRPAFREDEWILIVLGGVTGAIAGYLQFLLGFK